MSELPVPAQKSKLLLVLVFSLAVNCLLVGYLIGHTAASSPPPARPTASNAPVAAASFGERLKQLPGEERQKFQRAMQASRPDIRQAREDLVAARTRLSQAMAADPYDAQNMRDAFADVRAKTAVLQGRIQDATAQALAATSPETRKQLAGP